MSNTQYERLKYNTTFNKENLQKNPLIERNELNVPGFVANLPHLDLQQEIDIETQMKLAPISREQCYGHYVFECDDAKGLVIKAEKYVPPPNASGGRGMHHPDIDNFLLFQGNTRLIYPDNVSCTDLIDYRDFHIAQRNYSDAKHYQMPDIPRGGCQTRKLDRFTRYFNQRHQ